MAGLHGHVSQGAGLSLVAYKLGSAVLRCLVSVGNQAQTSFVCKAD